jgi:DNA-binding SARP family transcriptional activator
VSTPASSPGSGVRFSVLGAVGATTDRGVAQLKGVRQRTLLARLLVARGRTVSVDALIEALWEERPPAGATAALRTFVADLRRALEPGREPRRPPTLLITTPPGYALLAAPSTVDAGRFETLLTSSASALVDEPGVLGEALGLWRGQAYEEYADRSWARAEIDRLDELRHAAVERRAAALIARGRGDEAIPELRSHTAGQPLRENAWHLLATALFHAGRQADALAALRSARTVLGDELGLDPGPRLRELETAILTQVTSPPAAPSQPRVDAPSPKPAQTAQSVGPTEAALVSGTSVGPTEAARVSEALVGPAEAVRVSGTFVGRAAAVAVLETAAADVGARGVPVLALVTGEAGAGKTALAAELSRRLSERGWAALWARSPEHEGASVVWPQQWPWLEDGRKLGGGREVGGGLGRGGPVVLVVDDLHWADGDSLRLLSELLAGDGALLVVGTYRPEDAGDDLGAALARFARLEPVRVGLGGLAPGEVGDLVAAVAGQPVAVEVTAAITRRSGGNPFFVRELVRLHCSGADLADIPEGVRDVIRHRLAGLDSATRATLSRASVLGRDIDPELLGAFTGTGDVLTPLDTALAAGFLTDGDGLRFTHILVRDTLYDDLSSLRRAGWHAEAATVLERLRPHDAASLAHHLTQAIRLNQAGGLTRAGGLTQSGGVARVGGSARVIGGESSRRATPGGGTWGLAVKAARYAAIAGEQAEGRNNPHEAARLWRQALAAHELLGTGEDLGAGDMLGAGEVLGAGELLGAGEDLGAHELGAVMGLGRALALTGGLEETRALRGEAIRMAAESGDGELLARVLGAFDVPAVWPRNDDPELSARVAQAVRGALGRLAGESAELLAGESPGAGAGVEGAVVRSRLLSMLALETRGETGGEGREAAAEAERLAREAGDPSALALALNARFMHLTQRAGLASERAAVGRELVEVARSASLVSFEVLGHLIMVQSACAHGDVETADEHAAAADRLADEFELPMVAVFTRLYEALRRVLVGEPAGEAYEMALGLLEGSGMPGVAEGLRGLIGLACPETGLRGSELGPYQSWAEPGRLLAAAREAGTEREAGRLRDAAREALLALPESPHDLLREARLWLAAEAAIELDERETMRALYAELLPAAGELAGAGSGVLSFGPVIRQLTRLRRAFRE